MYDLYFRESEIRDRLDAARREAELLARAGVAPTARGWRPRRIELRFPLAALAFARALLPSAARG